MKDAVGNEVNVGDKIAYCTVGYSDLTIGVVLKLTPKGVSVENKNQYAFNKTLFRSSAQFVVVR